jgi:DnaJ-class molecular chaperone
MSMVLLIAAIAGIGYVMSLRMHPFTRCRTCNGGGRHRGLIYGGATRACGHCGGNGRVQRLGVRLFLGGTDKK